MRVPNNYPEAVPVPAHKPAASTKPFLRALAGETLTPPPFWLMRQAGRYLPEYRATRTQAGSFLDLCYNPELAVEVTLQPLRRYGMDAAILFSDILVVPDALRQRVAFREGEGPVLTPIRSAMDLDALDASGLHEHLAPVYRTVKGLSAAIPATTALIGFAGAPWTVATYMIEGSGSKDFANAKAMMFGRPELFARLMALLVQATGDYLIRQIDNGAEAVQVFDTWAGALPEDQFERWVIAPTRTLVERIHAERPGVPVIGFPRHAGVLYRRFVTETGVNGVSIDPGVPLAWAAETLQPHCTVQGNLDPILLLAGGEALDAGIDRILKVLGKGPFIFNLGHGIVPPTPPDNVARLAERVKGWKG
jgi:uroporphyrinogen decarboxylase